MRHAPLLAAAAATLLGIGCTSARLYPVSGPAVTQYGVLSAKLTNVPAGHGKFTVVMPDGESVEGTYTTSSEANWSLGQASTTGTAASDGPIVIAASDWAAVFDPTPSVARLQRGEARAKGSRGTVLSIEFAVNGGSGKAFGVAKDNRGSLYRFEIEGLPSGTSASANQVPPPRPAKIAK